MNEELLNQFNEEMEEGQEALDSKKYIDAWDHFFTAFSLKKTFFKSKRVSEKNIDDQEYAKSCYFLAQVIKEVKSTNELIDKLTKEDDDLIKNHYTGAKARRFIGRKYLKLAADRDYPAAIVEYALNCAGYAPQGKLDFEYNRNNLDTALYWANSVMKKHKNNYVSAMGYCIHAIYCLDQYRESSNIDFLNDFAKNILEANNINNNQFDQYITYYLGYLYSYPKLEDYEGGIYFDYDKGHQAFEEVVNKGSDEYLIRNARKLKEGIELKRPDAL